MTRYVAFLRGINVGGHRATRAQFREIFGQLGIDGADTFLASGNVVFDADGERSQLTRRIEGALRATLGYEVPTFLRTDQEIVRTAAHAPFAGKEPGDGGGLYVGFLRSAPEAGARERVLALSNDRDQLHLAGADLYWLRHGSLLESTISAALIEKTLGAPITVRNTNTVRRLAARFGGPALPGQDP